MSMKRFVVPNEPMQNQYFGSMSWVVDYNGNCMIFHNDKMKRGGKIILTNCHPGEEVGFYAAGPNSKAFKVAQPVDDKLLIMWRYGFTKPKRVTKWYSAEEFPGFHNELEFDYPGSKWRDENGVFILDKDVTYTTITDVMGYRILIETAVGRLANGQYIDRWYMHPTARLSDISRWLYQYQMLLKKEC